MASKSRSSRAMRRTSSSSASSMLRASALTTGPSWLSDPEPRPLLPDTPGPPDTVTLAWGSRLFTTNQPTPSPPTATSSDIILGRNSAVASPNVMPPNTRNPNPNIMMSGSQKKDIANAPTDTAAPTAMDAMARPMTSGPMSAASPTSIAAGNASIHMFSLSIVTLVEPMVTRTPPDSYSSSPVPRRRACATWLLRCCNGA
mmetsp:Transcript_476/g.1270  ORF Transcript_476/g.1270 Transcript_476/m.1270 type:complete len:201 (+) Transcript_476:697-1299(+)